jgi:hypothetical protein
VARLGKSVRNQLIGLGLFVVMGLAGGCTTAPKPLQSVDLRLQTQVTEAVSSGLTFEVWMSAVPGGIFGTYTDKPIVNLRVAGNGTATVSLAKLGSGLARVAVTALPDSLSLEPSNTRIARLSTIAGLPEDSARRFVSGLRDPSSGAVVILFYVDRPCVIRGVDKAPGANPKPFELHVMHKGLNWIETPEDFSDAGTLRLVEPRPDLVYKIREKH